MMSCDITLQPAFQYISIPLSAPSRPVKRLLFLPYWNKHRDRRDILL